MKVGKILTLLLFIPIFENPGIRFPRLDDRYFSHWLKSLIGSRKCFGLVFDGLISSKRASLDEQMATTETGYILSANLAACSRTSL
jgi:hypothetical protein